MDEYTSPTVNSRTTISYPRRALSTYVSFPVLPLVMADPGLAKLHGSMTWHTPLRLSQ